MENSDTTTTTDPMLIKAYELLYQFAITPNYKGFFHTSYAIMLSIQDLEKLSLVTKWLYPEVAKHYDTTPGCVERNIRTISGIAWANNPKLLMQVSGKSLDYKPTASQFIAMLTWYFINKDFLNNHSRSDGVSKTLPLSIAK